MRQLLILSGKGGTGKTTVASAFIELSAVAAFADCDVDAPNLHLVMRFDDEPRVTDSPGLPKASINQDLCIDCDRCLQECRYGAITFNEGHSVDPYACEGCALCEALCPVEAITLVPHVAGHLALYQDSYRTFSTATLTMGSGNSGKIVTEVKRQLKANAVSDLAIIDGSPGIGCPVIASLSGVDLVLIVTEPSVSGLSDLERILQTAALFATPCGVCLNKADTNRNKAALIADLCSERGIPFLGAIPYDPCAVAAVNRGETLAASESPAGRAIREVFAATMRLLARTTQPGQPADRAEEGTP